MAAHGSRGLPVTCLNGVCMPAVAAGARCVCRTPHMAQSTAWGVGCVRRRLKRATARAHRQQLLLWSGAQDRLEYQMCNGAGWMGGGGGVRGGELGGCGRGGSDKGGASHACLGRYGNSGDGGEKCTFHGMVCLCISFKPQMLYTAGAMFDVIFEPSQELEVNVAL